VQQESVSSAFRMHRLRIDTMSAGDIDADGDKPPCRLCDKTPAGPVRRDLSAVQENR
jgi:hypothetical protein